MGVLTAILTHLPADLVHTQLSFLRSMCPEAHFVICYGGSPQQFERLAPEPALFIEDPSLRGPLPQQSMNATLRALYEQRVAHDAGVELVYLIEYDHLILRTGFEQELRRLADGSPAGLFAKGASPRNDSNWPHYLRVRHDSRLRSFIASISRRDDHASRWGCLGTGMLFRRDALEAFCALPELPDYYFELFVPTVVYHLGFDVVDIDSVGDLYHGVRWLPEYSPREAREARDAGTVFIHPFKRIGELTAISATAGSGENRNVAAR